MACRSRVKVTYKKGKPDKLELVCDGDCPDKKTCEPTPKDVDPKKLTRQFCACPDAVEPVGCHIVLYTDPTKNPKKPDVYFQCEGNKCNAKETCAPAAVEHEVGKDGVPTMILFECSCLTADKVFPPPK